ncbi:Sensor histidine kinase LiaS [Streptomyces sp. YIM 130001]|uniref:sensor histidine kinase n=1 Tax=Streptomyces sp. YIM 130001 TaxID=2259644 RepID=UPI000E657428|nr:histidine kinase [Streptomyces sp. YIM 130001]RII08124.1 Sensor histidine kinase LiaS [Streptomyces sp. YIM 130001]
MRDSEQAAASTEPGGPAYAHGHGWPWLLPSALADDLDPDRQRGRTRRTVRDWIVDFICFLLAVGIGMITADALRTNPHVSTGLADADEILGALACASLWLRRRWPVQLAACLVLLGLVSESSGGAGAVALFTLAVHRPFRYVAWIGGFSTVTTGFFYWLRPDGEASYLVSTVFGVMVNVTIICTGLLVRSRRQLLLSLRDRARRAESEAALRAEQAQRQAREAIAREMHDVLAHRLTLLSVHAGALEFRPDAPTDEIARAAGVIRDSSHDALQDLREIIGVLRAGDGSEESGRPQPTLSGLPTLVAESRAAGMKVTLDNHVESPGDAPTGAGRNVYRIVQEGLTNARKHAPGAAVTVTVEGSAGHGLSVRVSNPPPPGDVPVVPGSGQGLIGLTERAGLAGGRLTHGRGPDGGFTVTAWLPWAEQSKPRNSASDR